VPHVNAQVGLAVQPDASRSFDGRDIITVIGLFIGVFAIGVDSFVISPILAPIAASLGTTADRAGLGVAAYAICYAIGAPVFGPLADRFGRRTMMLTGFLIFIVGTLLCSVAQTLTAFCGFRAISGLGAALVTPNVFAFVGATFPPPRMAKVMGIVLSALSMSIVLGVPIGSYVTQATAWQGAFILVSAIAAVALVIVALVLPGTGAGTRRQGYFASFATVFRTPRADLALLATLGWMTGFYAVYTYLGTFIRTEMGVDTGTVGTFLLAYGVGNFAASFFAGWFVARVGLLRTIALTGTVSAALVMMLGQLPDSAPLLVLVLMVWAILQGIGVTALTTNSSGAVTTVRSTMMAMNSSGIYFGLTIGSALGGALFAGGHFTRTTALGAIATLFSVVFALLSSRLPVTSD
jgi:DHA1 family inner membrane transport protein